MSFDFNPQNGFQKVSYKRKSRLKPKTEIAAQNELDPFFDKLANVRRVIQAKEELVTTDFFESVTASLREGLQTLDGKKFDEIICLGLGRVSQLLVSRYQLALLLCLRELYGVQVRASDPIFNEHDKILLDYFDVSVVDENLEGKYRAASGSVTLFYLPHCSRQLTNNLLWSNWGLNLNSCAIIANSFNQIVESRVGRWEVNESAGYIARICPYVLELAVINSFKYYEVFNDTAVHFFPWNRLKLISEDFWERNPEPAYDLTDLEFITKELPNKVILF
ncbi:SRR1-like protein [Cylas formicarius]|uniref:SRR1-like protein n=1 Tax=Cylas formicarius TaxID=197179 RepID=UPI002958BBE2|nr:SRR1-like protein [Cylas formicarius]